MDRRRFLGAVAPRAGRVARIGLLRPVAPPDRFVDALRDGLHTSSFYEQQGFMEGAVLSGQRAAREVYQLLRK